MPRRIWPWAITFWAQGFRRPRRRQRLFLQPGRDLAGHVHHHRVSFSTGLSGKLQSGDVVSMVAPDYKKQGQTVIPPELKYVEVISVTASSGYDANTGEAPSEEDERELPSTVTLLVMLEQSRVLAEPEADGSHTYFDCNGDGIIPY